MNGDGSDAARPAEGGVEPREFVVSQDGTKVAFTSLADDFGPTDTNGRTDVYVRDLSSGTTSLVSVNAAGTDSGNEQSFDVAISPDGTKVAFTTASSNLGPTDTDKACPSLFPVGIRPCVDVYVRDLTTGTTTLVSVNAAGTDSGNAQSVAPVFSPDGNEVAFVSLASDLGPPDPLTDCVLATIPGQGPVFGPCRDVYVRDLTTGAVEMISVDDGCCVDSVAPVFSPDGRQVAFESGGGVVYVRERDAATTSLVSYSTTGGPANGSSTDASFSPDGSQVLFASSSSNLGPPHSIDPGNTALQDLYVRDLDTGAITQVTTNRDGSDGSLGTMAGFSPDGTKVVFASNGDDLVATDTNGVGDVFVRDLVAGTTTLVSVNTSGRDSANNFSFAPRFSPDGTDVVFTSWADDLGPRDTIGCTPQFGYPRSCGDVYLRDLGGRRTVLVSSSADRNDSSNGDAAVPVFTSDGRIVYASRASNLGPTDTNGGWDIYIATVTAPTGP